MSIQSDFDTFIDGLRSAITTAVLDSNLPLVGDKLQSAATTALQFLDELKANVDSAMSAITPDSAAQEIADAFNNAHIVGITAVVDPNDSNQVKLAISESVTSNVALPSGNLDFGGSGFGLDANADFQAIITPHLDVGLSFNTSTGTLALVDSATSEVSVDVGVAVNISNGSGGPAEAHLGVDPVKLDIKVADNVPITNPEINLTFGLDFHSLNPTDFTATAGGAINADLGIETNVSTLLPDLFADLVVHYDFGNGGASVPTIEFNNVQIGLGSLLEKLSDTIKPVLDILSAFPFRDIINTVTDPLPIIGDIPKLLPFLHLDPIPQPDGDGVLNFLDLAAALDPGQAESISDFATALAVIKQLIALNDAAAGDKRIDLGSFDLGGGTATFQASTDPLQQLNTLIASTPGVVQDVLHGIENVINSLNPNPLSSGLSAAGGLEFPLFDDPSKIINLLVPSFGDGTPVKFIEYTLPELKYTASMSEFFPVIGPFGLSLNGDFSAAIQVSIGYDSMGFLTGIPTDGFYLSTPLVDPNNPLPSPLAPSPNGHLPVGYVTAAIHGGVGVSLVVASADIEGGFSGGVEAFFPGGDLRFTDIAEGCFFDPFSGELDADVALRITIGFGIFSWTHRIVFAEVTLADFSADCGGGVGVESAGGALATPNPNAAFGPDLLLNVGDRAGLRIIGNVHGTDDGSPGGEVYAIANATVADDILSVPTPLAGVLAVHAYGITENFGDAAHPMLTITAHLGNGDDSLSLAPDVTQQLIAFGDAGNDRIYGGAGGDIIHGGADDDTLVGNVGNDFLYGDGGNDYLEGGSGADFIDGGSGFDQVTYEHSASGVTFTPVFDGSQWTYVGHGPAGSDGDGDTLISIEYIIGSNFGDVLYANPSEGSTLEGLAGNDALVGGNGNDFLLGGPGADYMFGGAGEDGTSYLTSFGAVHVDLFFHTADGGDATGDVLIAMEDVQGSAFDDVMLGDNSKNTLDGWLGDDIIDGRGGPDIISGGDGNDIVYGGADGDRLDGGGGVDLLTYVNRPNGVTVNLRTGVGPGGDRMGYVEPNGVTFHQFVDYSSFENLTGSYNGDSLTGDLGYNTIRGLDGDDYIDGDGGNDILIGGKGADQLHGGDSIDTASYEDSLGGVYVNLLFGFGAYNDAQGDTLSTIENLRGSLWADTLVGDGGNNVINPYLSTLGLLAVLGAGVDPVNATGTPIDIVSGGGGYDTLVLDYSLGDFGQALIGGFNSADSGVFTRLNAAGTATLDGVAFGEMEALNVIGTIHDDQIYAGAGNDFVATGGGADLIVAGIGSDVILAQEDDDTVSYGTEDNELSSSSGGLNADGSNAVFFLDGGRGIDRLSISLSGISDDITLVGHDPGSEFFGTNLVLPNGSAVVNFETLGDVSTGSGNDWVEQPGNVDNNIHTGFGNDIILPGLGVDFVDGGADYQYGREITLTPYTVSEGEFTFFIPVVTDYEAFSANPGDMLVLDYSSFDGPGGVVGNVSQVQSQFQVYGYSEGYYPINVATNQGSYTAGQEGNADYTHIDFEEIERLLVSGTNQDDLLVGTYVTFESANSYSNATVRGSDYLNGLGGNDLLIGNSGSDFLYGGEGNDILIGADPNQPTFVNYGSGGGNDYGGGGGNDVGHFTSQTPNWNADQTEVDTLTGGAGADTFVLGTAAGFFYGSIFYYSETEVAQSNRAILSDFNPLDGDVIQLNGSSSQYYSVTQDGPGGHTETVLYYKTPGNDPGNYPDQVIAEILNFSGLDLNAPYIHYVGGPNGNGVEVAAMANIIAEANPPSAGFAALSFPDVSTITTFNLPQTSWVTQDNNPNDLLDALFGGAPPAGITTVSVDLVGDGRAFGTFSGDPFGIGSGIVLSTGQVLDLPGQNTVDGGYAAPKDVHLTFTAIGSFNGSTVYRADLSNLGININSLALHDSGSMTGGAPGAYSGFDIDAIALSHTFVGDYGANPVGVDMNAISALNVFDFSAAGLVFTQGTQRSGAYGSPDMNGTINGLVNNGWATLGTFDAAGFVGTPGAISLGDNGSLALNLTQQLSTSGPLYLYVAEGGANGETLSGDISVSNGRIDAPNDLSTDFGAPGAANDDISFTYTFMAAASVSQIAFQFALFSEELAEFAGSGFNDSFKILLNGVNLAQLSNGSAATVNNLMASPHVPLSADLVLNPAGPSSIDTHADAYTKLLTYVGAVQTGQNVLTIEVADVRDGLMDSGILVKAATFAAGVAGGGGGLSIDSGAIAAGSPPELFEGGAPIFIPITIDPGVSGVLTAPVTIDFTADSQLNFGNGAGVPFSHTFNPGDSFVFNLQVFAPDDHVIEGPRFDTIGVEVHSTDATFDSLAVAPIVVEIDDPQSSLSISDVSKTEGNTSLTAFDFTVTRTGGTAALTVDYSTADGTATAGSNDFLGGVGTLSFADGEMSKTISINVNGDISVEGDETFFVNLSNPNGATIADGLGVGTIVNDDTAGSGIDTSSYSANTTVSLTATGGGYVSTLTGKVTLTGPVNKFVTGAGNDTIVGNNNGDVLDGGAGNDTIRGGTGNDYIVGNAGTDRLTGGAGDDVFVFRSGFGQDTITDFAVGDATHHDTLDLRGLGFTSFMDVINHTDLGPNAIIHDGTDSIMLQNVTQSMLLNHPFDVLV